MKNRPARKFLMKVTAHGREYTYAELAEESMTSLNVTRRRLLNKWTPEQCLAAGPFARRPADVEPGGPGSIAWGHPWEIDDRAWYAVAHHPGGLTLEQVGALMGISRERVRQIEWMALRKLRLAAQESGEAAEVVGMLRMITALRDERGEAEEWDDV